MSHAMSHVDVNVPRFNQAVIALLTGIGFVIEMPALVVLGFSILFMSRVFGPKFAPLTQLYVRSLRRSSEITTEDARPPAFAQLLGTLFLGAASIAFLAGVPVLGWTLSLIVTALAALAATANICVGCILYQRYLEPSNG
jgi:hypothetical protein